jgi:hypothetical protein
MESNKNLGQLFKEFIYSDFMDAVIADRMLNSIEDNYKSLDLVVNLLRSGKGEERHYEEFEGLLDDIDALETVYVYYSGDYGYQSRLEEYDEY